MNHRRGKSAPNRRTRNPRFPDLVSELLILPDGRVLVHNLTPAFADLLHELNPDDGQIRPRAQQTTHHASRTTDHTHDLPD